MTKKCLLFLAWVVVVGWPLAAFAQPVGPEFQVNTYEQNTQWLPSVASDRRAISSWSGRGLAKRTPLASSVGGMTVGEILSVWSSR